MDSYNDIDRNTLLSHLYDVRALELARYKLSADIEKNNQQIRKLGFKTAMVKPEIAVKIVISACITIFNSGLFFVIAGATVFKNTITETLHFSSLLDHYDGFYLSSHIDYGGRTYIIPRNPAFGKYIAAAIFITIILTLFVCFIVGASAVKNRLAYNQRKNADDNRVREELKVKLQLLKANDNNANELKKLNSVLNENYSVNLIPQQFRNVEGICYLYDYLSTSRESFQSALMNFNMNRININMQRMLDNQSEMLIQQYITNARLADVKHQNNAMLNKLQSIENNTEMAAKYSALNEANTRTIAFFKSWEFFGNNGK